jgi:uncharacterized membrane protein YozB (DUF420 family)
MAALIMVQINLALQIATMALLVVSIVLKRKSKLFADGTAMLVAVILNTVSFLLIMGPSLLNLEQFVVEQPLDRLSMVALAHAAFGSVAEILGIWIVASWHLQASTQNCTGKKKLMRVTFLLWEIALILGVLFYVLLNTAILG